MGQWPLVPRRIAPRPPKLIGRGLRANGQDVRHRGRSTTTSTGMCDPGQPCFLGCEYRYMTLGMYYGIREDNLYYDTS